MFVVRLQNDSAVLSMILNQYPCMSNNKSNNCPDFEHLLRRYLGSLIALSTQEPIDLSRIIVEQSLSVVF